MSKKAVIALLMALSFFAEINAQSYQKNSTGIKATVASENIEIQFYSRSIVRIVKYPIGQGFNKQSLSVIATPQKTAFSSKKKGDIINLKSERLSINLDLTSGTISYFTKSGTPLLKEKKNDSVLTQFDDAGKSTLTVHQFFQLDKKKPINVLAQHKQVK